MVQQKIEGVWKATTPSVKIDGVWRVCGKIHVKVDGVWKLAYQKT